MLFYQLTLFSKVYIAIMYIFIKLVRKHFKAHADLSENILKRI